MYTKTAVNLHKGVFLWLAALPFVPVVSKYHETLASIPVYLWGLAAGLRPDAPLGSLLLLLAPTIIAAVNLTTRHRIDEYSLWDNRSRIRSIIVVQVIAWFLLSWAIFS